MVIHSLAFSGSHLLLSGGLAMQRLRAQPSIEGQMLIHISEVNDDARELA